MRVKLLSLLACLLAFAVHAAEPRSIVIVGDSLSAAYNMEVIESWPSLLQDRLERDGYAYRVFNSSIAGDTTQGGLARLPRLLKKQAPAIVLIELGGNDGLRGIQLDVTRGNLARMIEMSQAAGAQVILAEMRIPPNYGATYTERFHAMYGELAEETGATLLPFLLEDIALEPGMMMDDGIHPSIEAQPLILDAVWAELEPLLN
ncbi:MAG: arylesterase [Woeseiaceae bacterium]